MNDKHGPSSPDTETDVSLEDVEQEKDVYVSDRETEEDHQTLVLRDLYDRFRSRGRGWTGTSTRRHFPRGKRPSPGTTKKIDEQQSEETTTQWEPSPGMYRAKTGTGSSRYDPRLIGIVIEKEVGSRGWRQPIAVGSVIGQWEEIVGDLVAGHCPVESFEGGKLIIQADSTAWAQQMQLLLPQIMARIDQAVGEGVVEQVVVLPPKAPSWTHGKYRVPGRGPRDTYG